MLRPEACRPLIDFLAPEGERILEIGPGGGVLTRALLQAGARVWGAELDLEWAWQLRRSLGGEAALRIVAIDALDLEWERLPPSTMVAGNLPYNVATPILAALLPHHRQVPRAAFLLQKEVAERLTAKPGTRDYGALTVLVACHAEAMILGRVKPGAFRPPPKVDSAFVGLRLRPPPLPDADLPSFLAFVREGFGQKRKTLRNSLGRSVGPARVLTAIETLGLLPTARAEELSLERWLALWSLLR